MENLSKTAISDPIPGEGVFLSNLPDLPESPQAVTSLVISALGGYAKTARYFGLSRSAIHQWQKRGVPGNRVMALCRLADHKVKPEQIRPDIFGNPYSPTQNPEGSADACMGPGCIN